MNGMSYISGQIGRSARINLKYRHDKRYVGLGTVKSNQGIIGFDFLFQGLTDKEALATEDFFRQFVRRRPCRTVQEWYGWTECHALTVDAVTAFLMDGR